MKPAGFPFPFRRRLALLFTQVLSAAAMAKVTELFGGANVIALPADPLPAEA